MAKNLRTSLKQSIRASSKASLVGSNVFGSSPLDLRFALQKTLDPRVTFTRASTGTYVGSDGVLRSAAINEARFDHNPTTGESLGLLVEEARTNLLLNSATLSTQSVTVAAAANTLSFYGTGTVTLTGVSTAGPLVGTGANNRVSLTFTPTAGVLVLTVSGSVTNAQLELGAFPTSYIPTVAATATRAADVASITGANFSSWYRQDEGTFYGDAQTEFAVTAFPVIVDGRVSSTDIVQVGYITESLSVGYVKAGNVDQATMYNTGLSGVRRRRVACGMAANNFGVATNGGSIISDLNGTMPTNIASIFLGSVGGTSLLNGTIRRLTYWPIRLPNATLQAITTS